MALKGVGTIKGGSGNQFITGTGNNEIVAVLLPSRKQRPGRQRRLPAAPSVLQHTGGGIHNPGVYIMPGSSGKPLGMFAVIKNIRGSLINGNGHRVGGGIGVCPMELERSNFRVSFIIVYTYNVINKLYISSRNYKRNIT